MRKKVLIPIYLVALVAASMLILIIIAMTQRISRSAQSITSARNYIFFIIISMVLVFVLILVVGFVLAFYSDDAIKSNSSKSRFVMLSNIDNDLAHHKNELPNKTTLEELCETFRGYAAVNLHLYYSIEDIRKFISSLAVSHIIILQGMSGTGKTSLAYAFGKFLNNDSLIIPVQPMWKERSDLLGYYNEFTKKFNETPFLEKIYEANYKNDMFITILDEMNIARVEYYFAEFLSILEIPNDNGRYLDVISSSDKYDPKKLKNGQIKLPKNMWFIGTANNDDSTFAISDKVYDRAMIMNLDKKADSFDVETNKKLRVTAPYFEALCIKAKKEYKLRFRNKQRLDAFDNYLQKEFKFSFGNRIMKQINEYVPIYIGCGGDELEALDDIISKKIIRKLEGANSQYLKRKKDDLIKFIDDTFGYNKMPICKEMIESICKEL